MARSGLWRWLALLTIIIIATPVFFVWAFLLVDISIGFGLNILVKWVLIALLVLPLVAALYYLGARTRRAMISYTAQQPALQPRLGWAIISVLSFRASSCSP